MTIVSAESFQQRLLDAVPAAAYLCAADGRIACFNARAEELWGRRPALHDADDRFCGSLRLWTADGQLIAHDECCMALALRDNQSYTAREVVVERPDGTRRVVLAHASPLHDEEGRVCGAMNVLVDVTDAQRTADALRESEARFAAFMRTMPLVAFMKDAAGRHVYVNQAFEKNLNLRAEDCLGKTDSEIWPPETAQQFQANDRRILESGCMEVMEETIARPWGVEHWVSCKFPFRDAQGRPYLAGTALDISKLKQAEADLRRTSKLLQAVADGTSDAVFVKDLEGRYLFFNEAAAQFVGRPAASVLGQTDADIFEPESARVVGEQDRRVRELGRACTHEEELTAAGVTRTYLVTKAPYWDDAGNVAGVIGISRDITQRKQAERELRASEERLRALIAAVPDMIFRIDPAGVFVDCKVEPSEELIAPPEVFLGKSFREIMPPPIAEQIAHHIKLGRSTGALQTFEYELTPPRGERQWYEARLMVAPDEHTLVVARNVTQWKKLEEQFRQAQKMEAVGRLAGGVAHDFNNLLTVISGFSELLSMKLEADSPLRASVQAIQDATRRAAGLTRQLLAFSRKQVLAPAVLDLNDVVRSADEMLRRLIGENILMTVDLQADIDCVTVDRGQIEQVIMNLVVNARDTMPQGGRLTIATRNVSVFPAVTSGGGRAENFVELAVADTGHGMTDEIKARIFDPFFTTKELGKGTGLGLAVVHGVVSQSGGRIEVDSRPGEGSRFRVLLPASRRESACAVSDAPLPTAKGGRETILLVEDDDAVRQLALLALGELGYRVLAAKDGPAALALVDRRQADPDLLLTDVVMPEMSGPVLADLLRRRFPSLKLLYVSGYADDAVMQHGRLESSGAFLHKPYAPQSLAGKVREVLDQVPSVTFP